jgi:glutamine amidotransferase
MAAMCRIVGYLGPRVRLSELVERPPHSLYRQSYAARELETSVVSADGWGAAWYLAAEPEPCLYRCTLPIWGDANRGDLGRVADSHCILAAVRSATDPESISTHNTQPFRYQTLSFVHNGYIEGFRRTLRRAVCERLTSSAYDNIAGDTDSEHLFALIVDAWLRGALAGEPSGASAPRERLVTATREALGLMRSLARERSLKALFNVLVSDGQHLVAVRAGERAKSPSLYYKRSPERAIWFASEPLDAGDWTPVADESVLSVDVAGRLEQVPLGS